MAKCALAADNRMRALIIAAALAAGSSTASAQPETRGPAEVADQPVAGAPVATRVYYPTSAPQPGPIVAVVHGYGRTGQYHAEMARTLASRGFVAITPDLPCFTVCDFDANADTINELLDMVAAQASSSDSPLFGRVQAEVRGVVGHSWGSSVFVAAARDARIKAVVGLDPVDNAGAAAAVLPTVGAASLHLFAEGGGCGSGPWASSLLATASPPWSGLTVVDAYHCDAEDPGDFLCAGYCGTPAYDNTKALLFRRYAVAWLACELTSDAAMATWINGASIEADIAAGLVSGHLDSGLDQLGCVSGQSGLDGGPSVQPDAGPIPTTPDAAPHPDATPADASADSPANDSSGCRITTRDRPHAGSWLLILALVLCGQLRRRRQLTQ